MAKRPSVGDRESEEEKGKSIDQQIIDEAKHRFKRAQDWESEFRRLYIEDVKFSNGDSDNNWQWPDEIRKQRDINNRPCLTINKTKMHVLLLANEARQNPPQAKIKPVGEKVSYQAAQIWQGLIKHIQYVSNAQAVYVTAKESQLEGGIGYWRINTDYSDDRSFDQDVMIGPLDATKTYLDCDIKRIDGSDSMWGFIFDEFDRKEFTKQFPLVSLPPARSPSLDDRDDWIRKDAVRIAEYYRIKLLEDELLYIESGNDSWTGLRTEIPALWRDQLDDYRIGKVGTDFKSRKLMVRQLQWFKIAGNEIIDRNDGSDPKTKPLKGKYIPIVRMVGRERVIQGKLHRAGLVRTLKDPQRMYNYNTSGEVEVVALQTKTPWIVAAAAIEGNETAWKNANVTNAAYLTYRHIDDEGNPIAPPERMQPPAPAAGFLEGLRIAQAEMEMASGQYQAQQPNQTIERTPQAVNQRTRQSQLANYDFTDNEMQAVRHTAVIILDLAPHIYDRDRMLQIRADDGTVREIFVKPDQETAHESEPKGPDKPEKVYFNPKIGRYAVEADVGPSYQTRREEAWDAFVEIVKSSPELMNIIGDLGFLAADFPMAEQIAERFRRHIEQTAPWLLKDSQVGPVIQQLQQQLQEAQQQVAELMEKLSEARIHSRGKDELRDIEIEREKTSRLTAEAGAVKSLAEIGEEHGLKRLIQQTLAQMLGFSVDDLEKANKQVVDNQTESDEGSEAA